jgi:hypothetical protein
VGYGIALGIIALGVSVLALLVALGSAVRLNALQNAIGGSDTQSDPIEVTPSIVGLFDREGVVLSADPILLLFTSTSCGACESLLVLLETADLGIFTDKTVVISWGHPKVQLPDAGIRIIPDHGSFATLFGVSRFPSWLLVTDTEILAQGAGNELTQILLSAQLELRHT